MKIVLLSPYGHRLSSAFIPSGDRVLEHTGPISPADATGYRADWFVSYGYRHIVSPATLAVAPGRFLNLHISLLPWNRGADPNFWSIYDGTPRGVSIHEMDAGLDTGPLILQEPDHEMDPATDTLASTHAQLQSRIERLFAHNWHLLRDGGLTTRPQMGSGTHHRVRDKESLMARLPLGWQTPVQEVLRFRDQLKGGR